MTPDIDTPPPHTHTPEGGKERQKGDIWIKIDLVHI